ncbi:hypothetical protein DNTS_007926 [Danionella cerebrum]|uniref:Uncharacterized protein n=1 Tax=Danionella cerebrum TaxID=2873325 RepID=A0A553PVU6_9TELE|nr:hypothetical protein DNTS_007926 [Danionella translucida]TRY81765.1 hypothetical protein DNTS_007926 [Danionella translucida]
MTIGKSFNKNRALGSPPFLDKSNGFYGRLDEMFADDIQKQLKAEEVKPNRRNSGTVSSWKEDDVHVVEYNHGVMDDDGTTLLKRKPSRLSRRWSRMSLRKGKYDKFSSEKELFDETETSSSADLKALPTQTPSPSKEPEAPMVHFSVKEHADDQNLLTVKKGGEKDDKGKEKKTEGKLNGETKAVVKRNTLKDYRKAMDKAVRRGWETFVANLYSVTLTPISSTSSSKASDKADLNRSRVLAEFQ